MDATKEKKAPPQNVDVLKQPYVRIPVSLHQRLSRIAQRLNLVPSDNTRRSQVNIGIARLLEIWADEAEKNE